MDRALKGKDIMTSNNHRDPPKRCPRCESTNTKFCYFNNYSQSQPRHFCRACRRYWTEGGTLRNVPQGGGSYRRGNKRSRRAPPPPPAPATTGSEVSIAAAPPAQPPQPPTPPTPFIFGGGDGTMTTVFQPFHPGCAGMVPDFLGFNSASDPMMPGFFNLPMHPPMQPSVFDTNLMIGQQPRLAVTSHQQMNITVFTSSTAAAAAGSNVSSAGAGNGEGYWNEFNNEGEDDSSQPPTP